MLLLDQELHRSSQSRTTPSSWTRNGLKIKLGEVAALQLGPTAVRMVPDGALVLRVAVRASLTINYRTPDTVMAEAEPLIRAVLPEANVPTSVRTSDAPLVHGSVSELGPIVDTWLAAHADGIACAA